jgi:hypothetical protein
VREQSSLGGFFFPAEEGVDEKKWGERERSLALRALLLSVAARSRLLLTRQNSFRARALLPRIFFAPKRRSRARLSSRQSSSVCFRFR